MVVLHCAHLRLISFDYRASAAQWHSDRAARRPKPSKLATHAALSRNVLLARSPASEVSGPDVVWKGRRAAHRQSRRWSTAWSPEQISHRLRLDYPEDPTMRISHEAIYQSLYIQGRGALRRELTACLRSGRALRLPRERARCRGKSFMANAIMSASDRPRSPTEPFLGIGKAISSSVWKARPSERWWSGLLASQCCCICRELKAISEDKASRMDHRLPVAALKPCEKRLRDR
jgi:hypothetical protein